MRIAICDDEENIRMSLKEKALDICPDDEIFEFSTGDELLKSGYAPDIALLDIVMPGISGVEVARQLRQKYNNVIIIFITGEDGFVFDAFDVHAYHYIVKPFSDEKLKEVLLSAKEHYLKNYASKEKKYTMVNSRGSHVRLCLDDIVYAEVFNSKVIVHTIDTDIEYYGKLTDLEKLAGKNFFRTHRGFLVNLKFVNRYDSSNVYLTNGAALVSKQNYPLFVKALMEYNKDN